MNEESKIKLTFLAPIVSIIATCVPVWFLNVHVYGIKLNSSDLSSILQAVSIIYGIIFIGFFYFKDKTINHIKMTLDSVYFFNIEIKELLKKVDKKKADHEEIPKEVQELIDEVVNFNSGANKRLQDQHVILNNFILYTQIFFKSVFVLFSIAVIICIIATSIDAELQNDVLTRLSQAILVYVILSIIYFTIIFYKIWEVSDEADSLIMAVSHAVNLHKRIISMIE